MLLLRACIHSLRLSVPPLLDSLREIGKGLGHILARLRARLEKLHVEFLCQLLALLCCYQLLIFEITFVPEEDLLDGVASTLGMSVKLADPMLHALEALLAGAVVGENDAVGLVEVLHGHRAEALLAGCVPDNQLYVLAVELNELHLEVYPYRADVVGAEFVVGEALEEGGLAHLGVSQCDHLDLHIILSLSAFHYDIKYYIPTNTRNSLHSLK